MDPKILFLLTGLAACPASHTQPTLHSITPPSMPVYVWPERQERPEDADPAHGEGSDGSVMFVGINSNACKSKGSAIARAIEVLRRFALRGGRMRPPLRESISL
jgi:hypothetical protein